MKSIKTSIIILLIVLVTVLTGTVYAADKMELNITDARPYNEPKTIYKVETDNTNKHAIFKIVKKDVNAKEKFVELERNGELIKYTYNNALYCLRSGLGFGNSGEINDVEIQNDVIYQRSHNLFDGIPQIDIFRNNMNIQNYNSILWLVDNMYLPEHEDAKYMKNKLLEKAEITDDKITDDDIEFVQQMALWYFSNYDENGEKNSLSLKIDNIEEFSLSNRTKMFNENENEIDVTNERKINIDKLYRYLIKEASAYGNANKEQVKKVEHIKTTVNVDDVKKTVEKDELNFSIVGPFTITTTEGNIDYNLEFKVTDATGKVIPIIEDEIPQVYIVKNKEDIASLSNSINEMIGQGEFYLRITNAEKYDLTDVNIKSELTHHTYYNTTATLWIAGNEDQPVLEVEKERVLEGNFNININKVDEEGNPLKGAGFKIETDNRQNVIIVDNGEGEFLASNIVITEKGQEYIYDISETVVPNGYTGIKPIRIKVTTNVSEDGTKYELDKVILIDSEGKEITIDGVTVGISEDKTTVEIEVVNKKIKVFDLALRKYITKVEEAEVETRVPQINISKLQTETTAHYNHRKDPVKVETGDLVTYNISVYNEGEIPGKVTEIIDYLPEGLEFDIKSNPKYIEQKENYTEEELQGKEYKYIFNSETRELKITSIKDEPLFLLNEFNGEALDEKFIELVCKVTAEKTNEDIVLTNIATMKYEPIVEKDEAVEDRDSVSYPDTDQFKLPKPGEEWEEYKGHKDNQPYLGDKEYFYKGQEDDDDFEKVVIKGVPFDLSLRKFITKVNGKEITSRIPQINTTKLNTVDTSTGKTIETATYTHSKEPVVVKQGDIVTYTIRVYNEGELNGYATKIADYLPEGLGYLVNYKENTNNLWVAEPNEETEIIDLVGVDGLYKAEKNINNLQAEDFDDAESLKDVKILKGKAKIYSTALDDELIKAYNPNTRVEDIEDVGDKWQATSNGAEGLKDGLYYKDVEITCIVLEENTFKGTIRNIAEIAEYKAEDEDKNELKVEDRDSAPNNVDITKYEPIGDNSTYQQDDDDYELLELRYFDLALRKFITKVGDKEITTRIPEVTIDDEGKIKYVHDKTPVYVSNSDIVTYTIRVYNEGTLNGYATEISDDIPDGLVFLPDHETNKEYKWIMLDKDGKETEDPNEAVEIRTNYLENTLLDAYDATNEPLKPANADVKVAFQVIEENITQEDRIIINKAQITDDKAVDEDGKEIDIDDEDSIPDEWNEGEDDQDTEKIYVQKFDLALLKWVTKTIVTVDGKTTTTETGFTPYDDPEPIAKVVLDKKKLNKTTVKFAYNIIIMNQGEIEGYATEITDYIPEGLEFVAEDNPLWTKEGTNKITTRALENKLLKPGESATVEVIFTWKKDANNLGIKTNIAEISEDYNEKGSKDIDSTPDNVKTSGYDKQQEDDDDKALVMLEIKTGGPVQSYLWLVLVTLMIITGGIVLIKKFVIC